MEDGARKFTVILEPDERVGFAVHCPAVKCSSQGHDRAEALEMIVECIQITLDEYETPGKAILLWSPCHYRRPRYCSRKRSEIFWSSTSSTRCQ